MKIGSFFGDEIMSTQPVVTLSNRGKKLQVYSLLSVVFGLLPSRLPVLTWLH